MLSLLVAAAFRLPRMGVWPLLLVVSALGLLEFYRLLDKAGIPSFRILGVVGGSALISAAFFSVQRITVESAATGFNRTLNTGEWEWFVLYGILLAIFLRQFPRKNDERSLATIACTLLGILYVPFLFNFITRLAFTWGLDTGRMMVLYLVVVVKGTDMGAFAVGSALGRHKMVPRVSPGKTWEGCVGGVLCGVLASGLFHWLSNGTIGGIPAHASHALVLGVLLAVVGTLGDLVESLLKRATGAKDSSALVPGLGGLLDVLDSLLLSAPVLYMYARLFL